MSNLKYKHTAYTSAQWASLNPVIVENEIVIESDTKRTKIGNGISTYNELEYADANSDKQTKADAALQNVEIGLKANSSDVIILNNVLGSLTPIVGVNEPSNGYYWKTNGGISANANYKSVKYPVNDSMILFASSIVLGSATALAIYLNAAGAFISYEKSGNDVAPIIYTREKLSIPAGTAFVCMTKFGNDYPVLEEFILSSVAKAKDLTLTNARVLNIETNVFGTPVVGIQEAVNGYYTNTYAGFKPNAAFKSIKYPVDFLKIYYATTITNGSATALAVYLTSTGVFISAEKLGNNVAPIIYTREKLSIPAGTAFVCMTKFGNDYPVLELESAFLLPFSKRIIALEATNTPSNWDGKKIAWYGTSIPAGYPHTDNQELYSYANRAAKKLGSIIQNYAVPNGIIRKFDASGAATSRGANLSFTNTAGTANYLTQMLNLIGTSNEPDLFVFDYSVNDYDEDQTDIDAGNWDMTSVDPKYFHGALNFCIKSLLQAKPRARIALFTHYSQDAAQTYPNWGKTNDVIEAVGKYWGIPVCKVYEKSMLINHNGINTIDISMSDHVHPATDATGKTVELLTNIVYEFLKGIS